MKDLRSLSDADLFFSCGSIRPKRGRGLSELASPMSEADLAREQEDYDRCVSEMKRRDEVGFFPFHIPKSREELGE